LPFPPELFEIIGEFLAGEFKLGSLASLNVTNRLLHKATSPVLWTTVTLDNANPYWSALLNQDARDADELLYHITPTEERHLQMAKEAFEQWKVIPGALPENLRYVK
jgi:hypothetical protein